MHFFRLVLLVFPFLFSILAFSQTYMTTPADAENNPAAALAKKREAQLKADILREIQTFSRPEQAYFYARLGSVYWEHSRKEEGISWLTKGVELAINPAAVYKNDKEKLSGLWNILSNVLEKDAVLANKLIAEILKIKIDESNTDILKEANQSYILIAQQILSRKEDEKLAFDFAMLSLKGKKPAVNYHSEKFFQQLKFKNENLANTYFSKLTETVKNSGDKDLASGVVNLVIHHRFETGARFNVSDSQMKELLELLASFIAKESEELSGKKRSDCDTTKSGYGFLKEYKRLLPEKTPIIEQAVAVCENSGIDAWKKPGFIKKPLKTAQDFLDLAKEIGDKKIQANYLKIAATIARNEKNYLLSNSILDGIDKELRDEHWNWMRIESPSKLIEELFKTDDFAEITKVLDGEPPELRSFIIVNSLNLIWRLKPNQKEFVLGLMNQARADFNKIDKFSADTSRYATNPTKFGDLTQLYVKFGFYDEAIAAHEESIKSLNRIAVSLPSEYKEKNIIPIVVSYSTFTRRFPPGDLDFLNRYYDRIYENIGKIENSRTRLRELFGLLERNLEKAPDPLLIPGIPRNIK